MIAPTDIAGYDPHRDAAGYWFDSDEAEKRLKFFELVLTHVIGKKARQPFKLEDTQKDWIATLFGWKCQTDSSRRYRSAFFLLPRKNGKSNLAAGIALSCLHLDNEGGAECYCAASDIKQAGIVYRVAAGMTRESAALAKVTKVRDATKRLVVDSTNSFLVAVPANEGALHGTNPHVIVGDEIHVWPDRRLYEALHTGIGAREQPLEIFITTAAEEGESPLFDEMYTAAINVRDGIAKNPRHLPVIYEATKEDDWTHPDTWRKANPLYGVSIREEYLAEECERAQHNLSNEASFKRLHLNIRTSSIARWIKDEHWHDCPATDEPITGDNIVGGLDLSSIHDLTAWCIYDPDAQRMRWRYFIPEDIMGEKERNDRVPYRMWAEKGYVTATPGRSVDYDTVLQAIYEDIEEHGIRLVAYDPWQADHIYQSIERNTGCETFKAGQGIAAISAPTKEFGRLVVAHELDHGNNPVTNWCAVNFHVRVDVNGNVQPKKDIERKRIDGIVAAINSVSAALSQPPLPPPYYDDHELEMV